MSTDENNKTDDGDDESLFGPVIFSYTRQQAIEDGVLVDLSEWAKQEGYAIPVACTSAPLARLDRPSGEGQVDGPV